MVDGEVMEEVPSLEKIHQKSTDQQLMQQDGLPKIWFQTDFVKDVWFKLLMELVSLNH